MFFENWHYWLGGLLGVLYLVFGALKSTSSALDFYKERETRYASWKRVTLRYKVKLWLITVGIFFLVLLLYWLYLILLIGSELWERLRWNKSKWKIPFVCRYYQRLEQRQKQEQEERTQQIEAWKKDHPPVLCCNEMNGILAVMREEDYLKAKEETERAVMDGYWPKDARVLCPARETYIFCHASAKENARVPNRFVAGKKSDVMIGMAKKATLRHCPDIFVPFVSEHFYRFEEQEKKLFTPSWEQMNKLMHVEVPLELSQ